MPVLKPIHTAATECLMVMHPLRKLNMTSKALGWARKFELPTQLEAVSASAYARRVGFPFAKVDWGKG